MSCHRQDRNEWNVNILFRWFQLFWKHMTVLSNTNEQLAYSVHLVTTITFPDWENMGQILIWIFFMFQGKCSTLEILVSNAKQLCTNADWLQNIYRTLRKRSGKKKKIQPLHYSQHPFLASRPLLVVVECPNNRRDTVFFTEDCSPSPCVKI